MAEAGGEHTDNIRKLVRVGKNTIIGAWGCNCILCFDLIEQKVLCQGSTSENKKTVLLRGGGYSTSNFKLHRQGHSRTCTGYLNPINRCETKIM